jgi:hypothetical protein
VTFGAALEPAFGGMIFCVVREMAKVVEKELISPGSESSSEDICAAGGYNSVKQAS